jgi:uncharacterized protein YecE (DUF72 family)
MIRVGIGGWTFEPWRGPFYPEGLPQARELEYAAGRLTAIEINGTFYGSQKPESFRRWAAEAPDGFLFSAKAPRFATNRRILAEAGDSVNRFIDGGLLELGDKLGPILWQFAATKKFDPADFGAFLALLPHERAGRRIRHAVEVRHDSFKDPEFIAMARAAGVAVVTAQSAKYPEINDATADFVYLRLQGTQEDEPAGYPPAVLDQWLARARAWEAGGAPADLPTVAPPVPSGPRDCFVFMISGAKVRNPAAAMALIERID